MAQDIKVKTLQNNIKHNLETIENEYLTIP